MCVTFSSHGQSSTGSVAVTTTCATSPLSQITSKTKKKMSQWFSGVPGSSSDGAKMLGTEVPRNVETVPMGSPSLTVSMDLAVAMDCAAEWTVQKFAMVEQADVHCVFALFSGLVHYFPSTAEERDQCENSF